MSNSGWKTLDVAQMIKKEETTSANVGAYPVPLGQPLRRVVPGLGKVGVPAAPKKPKKVQK